MRTLARIAIGLLLAAGAAVTFAACFVDPVPPDPHNHPDPDKLILADGGADGGEAAP